jgi:hypothetical protein
MTVELTDKEMEVVVELLETHLKDILVEIRHTTSREFRQELQGREQVLAALLGKVGTLQGKP